MPICCFSFLCFFALRAISLVATTASSFFLGGGGSAAQASELTNLVQKEIDKRHPDGSGSNTGNQLSLRQKKQLEQINQALHTNQLDIRSPLGQAFSRAIASSEEASISSSFQKKTKTARERTKRCEDAFVRPTRGLLKLLERHPGDAWQADKYQELSTKKKAEYRLEWARGQQKEP